MIRFGRLAFVTLLAAWLAAPQQLFAHGALKSSTPAKDATVAAPLRELRLEFNEAPEMAFTSVTLLSPGGITIALGDAERSGTNTIVLAVRGAVEPGRHTVKWKTAGRDGHPVTGEFQFTVAAPPAAPSAPPLPTGSADGTLPPNDARAPAESQPPKETHHDPIVFPDGRSFDAESPGYVAIRWVQFVALLSLIGAVAFIYFVVRRLRRRSTDTDMLDAAESRAGSVAMWAGAMLLAMAIVRLIAQSYAMHGPDQTVLAVMKPMILSTTWGVGWLLQLAGSAIVVAAVMLSREGSRLRWMIVPIGAVVLAFSPALSGHAASTPRFTAAVIVADAVHVMGAAGWLGSLLLVLIAGIPAAMRLEADRRGAAVADIVNAFSPTALTFGSIVAATGLFAAWMHVGSVSGLWESRYGVTLFIKLAILSVVVGTGAYNWLRVRPSLGDAGGAGRVRKSATVELAVALFVLAVTAVLVATPTPMDS